MNFFEYYKNNFNNLILIYLDFMYYTMFKYTIIVNIVIVVLNFYR